MCSEEIYSRVFEQKDFSDFEVFFSHHMTNWLFSRDERKQRFLLCYVMHNTYVMMIVIMILWNRIFLRPDSL